jgi:hypothetical protein
VLDTLGYGPGITVIVVIGKRILGSKREPFLSSLFLAT